MKTISSRASERPCSSSWCRAPLPLTITFILIILAALILIMATSAITAEGQAKPTTEDQCPIRHRNALEPSYFIKWTPDGSQVIFNHGSRIYVARTDGTQEEIENSTHYVPGTYADISPDGSMIDYSACRASPGIPSNSEIEVLELETGEITPITTTPGYERFPEWSPDGRQIAFVYAEGRHTGITTVSFSPESQPTT